METNPKEASILIDQFKNQLDNLVHLFHTKIPRSERSRALNVAEAFLSRLRQSVTAELDDKKGHASSTPGPHLSNGGDDYIIGSDAHSAAVNDLTANKPKETQINSNPLSEGNKTDGTGVTHLVTPGLQELSSSAVATASSKGSEISEHPSGATDDSEFADVRITRSMLRSGERNPKAGRVGGYSTTPKQMKKRYTGKLVRTSLTDRPVSLPQSSRNQVRLKGKLSVNRTQKISNHHRHRKPRAVKQTEKMELDRCSGVGELCEGRCIPDNDVPLSTSVGRIDDVSSPASGPGVCCRRCRLEFEHYDYFTKHTCSKNEKKEDKVFKCDQCSLSFTQQLRFQRHAARHGINSCKICHAHFTRRKALAKHIKAVHGSQVQPERYYHCPHCERKFIKRPSLFTHLKEHAGFKIVCMKCGLMCDDDQHYSQHMQKHTEEAKFHCDKCDECFVRRQQYEQHMAGHNKYDCTLCDKNFSAKKQLLKHRSLVHGIRTREEKRYECHLCHKRFQRPMLVRIHMRVHTGERPVRCAHCNKAFRTETSLAKHLKSASHMKACGQTSTTAITASAAAAHTSDPSTDEDKTFLCAECGAKFHRKQGLFRHMQQLHSEERPFVCQFCDYKCKCKTNLERHVKLHKDERRFVCELCGASFHAHATLKEHHAYVHSDIRNFVCPNCGKGFKGRSGLRRHIRSHSDARPFVCNCGQSYKRMSHLKRHMMSMHGTTVKSKRVQRLQAGEPVVSEPSSSLGFYDDANRSTYDSSSSSMQIATTTTTSILEVPLDGPLMHTTADTIMLPVGTTADGLLIIDNNSVTEHGVPGEAPTVTLEVTTHPVGCQDLVAHMQMSCGTPQGISQTVNQSYPTTTTVNSHGIPLTISSAIPSATDSLLSSMTPIGDGGSDLRQALDLAGVTIQPISSHGNITVAISTTDQQSLPSMQQSAVFHPIQSFSSSPTVVPALSGSTAMGGNQHTLSTLTPEFFNQNLAQFLSM